MEVQQALVNILNTLNKVTVSGYENMSYMLGSMQLLQELLTPATQEELELGDTNE